mgnify:CR=1 FL=1
MIAGRAAVLGAGAWGTALACLLASRGHPTVLWARRAELAKALHEDRENRTYLPGVPLPPALRITADLTEATVHGVLHLCGYDHEADDGEMLALQARILEGMAR